MFIYREKDIKNMRDNLLFGKIQIFSPTISENIKAISNIEKLEKKEELSNEEKEILSDSKILIKTRDINPKIYSTELAKAQLYMNKFKHRTWNKILGELAVEAAFGSYLYQKDNGYSFNTFENFFNNEPNHPFNFMFAYVNADKMLYEDEDGKRFDYLPLIAIRKSVSRKYSSFFNQTLSHEILHQVSGYGITTGEKDMKKATRTLNEMCTEYNSFLIVKNILIQILVKIL